MDILRDVAFEVYFKTTEIYKREVRIRKADILFFSENFGYFNIVANEALHLWKEAKAQAVPEGFVLVPKEPTPKMIDSTWHHDDEIQEMSHNTRNEFIYKSMIKAQEQGHE